MQLPAEDPKEAKREQKRAGLSDWMDLAQKWFAANLRRSVGKAALLAKIEKPAAIERLEEMWPRPELERYMALMRTALGRAGLLRAEDAEPHLADEDRATVLTTLADADVIVVGAGVAGLAAAAHLTAAGRHVEVLEQDVTVGGRVGSSLVDGVWSGSGWWRRCCLRPCTRRRASRTASASAVSS